MKKEQRRKDLVKVIRSTWTSLDSHLDKCVSMSETEREYCGSEMFHIKTSREYAEMIKILTENL